MVNLSGHEAGNGGYRQGEPTIVWRDLLYSEPATDGRIRHLNAKLDYQIFYVDLEAQCEACHRAIRQARWKLFAGKWRLR